jgi:diacylglycerol kinase family enzyme
MYHFIVNIAGGSGKAKKTWDKVSSILDKKFIERSRIVVPAMLV